MSTANTQQPATGEKWYSIRQRTPVASAIQGARAAHEILIYGDIGQSWWDETITASDFVRELTAIDADAITVRINSIGGSVPDGIAIYNAIKRHKAKITTVVDAMALSIASLIAMAGDEVQMAENAVLMVHAPWTYAAGNSADLRDTADQLDTWASAMSTSYASKTGKSKEEVMALLTDGKDHWYTAEEAKAFGFADVVTAALPDGVTASLMPVASLDVNRFRDVPAAMAAQIGAMQQAAQQSAQTSANPAQVKPTSVAVATSTPENPMPEKDNTPAAAKPATPDAAAILAADKQRRQDIRDKFAWAAKKGHNVAALQQACEDDAACTPQAAGEKLLELMAKEATPVAGHVATVADESDKRREAVSAALMARAGYATAEQRKVLASNPFRGMTLLDVARASLQAAGVRTEGMDKMQLVAAAFTQGTSDFPILLENTMHRTLQAAYATAPDTWSRFCARGSVSDFRAHPRYRVGSLGNLLAKNELGEFQNVAIPDGEKSVVSAATKGYIINLSREAVVNDDLGAFVGLANSLGRAARRTVEADVYTALASNGGLGPVLQDGKTLFHADHGNITSAAALSMVAIDADRVAMASQKDVGGNDYLDLRPQVLVVPIGLGGTARSINSAEYDPDTANKLQKPNVVRGLFNDIVDTPRLTGTRRYLFAGASDAPVMEVAFLDGNDVPFLELENGFTVDGARYKVRLDYGVAGIDFRGAVTNAGA